MINFKFFNDFINLFPSTGKNVEATYLFVDGESGKVMETHDVEEFQKFIHGLIDAEYGKISKQKPQESESEESDVDDDETDILDCDRDCENCDFAEECPANCTEEDYDDDDMAEYTRLEIPVSGVFGIAALLGSVAALIAALKMRK